MKAIQTTNRMQHIMQKANKKKNIAINKTKHNKQNNGNNNAKQNMYKGGGKLNHKKSF